MVARHPDWNRDSFAWRLFKFLQVFGVLPAQDKLAARIIHGCEEMVKQSGPDDSVDLFYAESFGKLAQRKHCGGQIFDSPIAAGQWLNPTKVDLSVLSARK